MGTPTGIRTPPFLHCPECRAVFNPVAVMGSESLEPGHHGVECPGCAAWLNFLTHVSYSFAAIGPQVAEASR